MLRFFSPLHFLTSTRPFVFGTNSCLALFLGSGTPLQPLFFLILCKWVPDLPPVRRPCSIGVFAQAGCSSTVRRMFVYRRFELSFLFRDFLGRVSSFPVPGAGPTVFLFTFLLAAITGTLSIIFYCSLNFFSFW